MAILLAIVIFALGFISGLFQKGVNITITHKQEQQPEQPKKQEYNESLADMLPKEVQQYYQETNGMNRF